jgi:hypothetical protein
VFFPGLDVLGCSGGGTRVGDEGCDWKVLDVSAGLLSLERLGLAGLALLFKMGRVGLCCPDQVVFALLAVDGRSLNAEFAPLIVLECRSESLSFPLSVLACRIMISASSIYFSRLCLADVQLCFASGFNSCCTNSFTTPEPCASTVRMC